MSSLNELLICGLLLALVGCGQGDPEPRPRPSLPEKPARAAVVSQGQAAMGTLFEITAVDSGVATEDGIQAALAEIRRVEQLMTTWDPAAPLSRVNEAAGGDPVRVPEELARIVAQSLEISELTEGAFDVSFASMGRLWDFRADPPVLPAAAAVAKGIALIDYRGIELDTRAGTLRLRRSGMRISLGAIAKGYAVDRVAAILREHGIESFIVYGGGDVLASGKRGGRPWTVGIPDPRASNRHFARIELPGSKAVVTSGDYERYFEMDGKRYHHIIDPRTGYPATASTSVTVVAPSAARADALATGLFVLGPARGMALVEEDPELEALFVDAELAVTVSTGLRPHVTVSPIAGTEGGAK